MMRVVLVGEGRNDVGDDHPIASHGPGSRGFLGAWFDRTYGGSWHRVQVIRWKSLPRYQAGAFRRGGRDREADAVRKLALRVSDLQVRGFEVDVVVMLRDDDGARRGGTIRSALGEVDRPDGPRFLGGVPVPSLEAWILALAGVRGADGWSRARLEEACTRLGCDTTASIECLVGSADLQTAATCSSSLAELLDALASLPAPRAG